MLYFRFLTTLLLVFPVFAFSQSETKFNKILADSLGADEYEMKTYQFVILQTGSRQIDNKDSVQKIFNGHLQNIGRLAKGKTGSSRTFWQK